MIVFWTLILLILRLCPKLLESYRKKEVITKLIERYVGKAISVEITPVRSSHGYFVHLQINHDIFRTLPHFVSISMNGKRYLYAIKHEKLGLLVG
jgi:hypothetical protein